MITTEKPPSLETSPILGFDEEFPDTLCVIAHTTSKRYGCYCHQNVHGLACFSTESGASGFCKFIDLDSLKIVEVSFDEALDIAKDRPMPVTAVFLLDDIANPKIHYVK